MNSYGTLITHVKGITDVQITDVKDILNQIRDLSKASGLNIQLVDAKNIASEEHIQIASYHAQKSFRQKTATSNSIEIETLLYATGQRQISKALAYLGISHETKSVIAIIFSEKNINNFLNVTEELERILNGKQTNKIFELTKEKESNLIDLFGITQEELQVIPLQELIIEKMAILELSKKPSQDITEI